jgi:hypothetical protein
MPEDIRVTSTGIQAEVPANKMPGVGHRAVPDFDGKHLWIVTVAYRVNPATFNAANPIHLDTENLLLVSGAGCFWCEQEYSLLLSSKPCKGDASPGWR